MAVKNGKTYQPGVIYELGEATPLWKPFYVGETCDAARRLNDHKRNSKTYNTAVYRHIRDLNSKKIPWEMRVVSKYGSEGPTSLEHDFIIKNLLAGFKLKNEKKGNENWMVHWEEVVLDMKSRGISSYTQYKEIITAEELAAKHAKWLQEVEDLKQKEARELIIRAQKKHRDQGLLFVDGKKVTAPQKAIEQPDLRGYKESDNEEAQRLFNQGKYTAAKNVLGGTRAFFEAFGIEFRDL